jgi:UDP-N-acetylglucosamine acyltransferase
VSVGPYSIVGPQVAIGDDTNVDAHVIVRGPAEIGERCRIFPFSSIGDIPQDLKFKGESTKVVIGNDTIIREYVTINRGTEEGGGVTSVGNSCLLMAYTHVAHDCTLKDCVIMANASTLAGHIEIDDFAIIGGLVAIHQFVRIGRNAMVGGCSGVGKDVAPYCLASGSRASLYGLNLTGLKRHKFPPETIKNLKNAYRIVFRSSLPLKEAIARTKETIKDCAEVDHFIAFIKKSQRGIMR